MTCGVGRRLPGAVKDRTGDDSGAKLLYFIGFSSVRGD